MFSSRRVGHLSKCLLSFGFPVPNDSLEPENQNIANISLLYYFAFVMYM